MQALLPRIRSNGAVLLTAATLPSLPPHTQLTGNASSTLSLESQPHHFRQAVSLPKLCSLSSSSSSSFLLPFKGCQPKAYASASVFTAFISPDEEGERAKLAQVAKRLEKTSRYFKRLGSFGFWGQLVCTVVAAVILSFSSVITGKVTSPATFYATAVGIAAAFISVFWSFGYINLSDRLRRTANEPAKEIHPSIIVTYNACQAPLRSEVVKSLKNGIVLNIIGMGAAILGMQATVGFLVAKDLTTSTVPFYQGLAPGSSPVLAMDVFLVQASANTILSHFLGLVSSLELLRSVTLPTSEAAPVP